MTGQVDANANEVEIERNSSHQYYFDRRLSRNGFSLSIAKLLFIKMSDVAGKRKPAGRTEDASRAKKTQKLANGKASQLESKLDAETKLQTEETARLRERCYTSGVRFCHLNFDLSW